MGVGGGEGGSGQQRSQGRGQGPLWGDPLWRQRKSALVYWEGTERELCVCVGGGGEGECEERG